MAARKTPSKGGKPDKLMRDALLLELNQEVKIDGGKVRKYRLVARSLITAGIGGDIQAIKEINDRVDGKTPSSIELAGKDGGPIETKDVSDHERARALAAFMAKTGAVDDRSGGT